MLPKLMIWDWNGTILCDQQVCYDIANEMLTKRGIPALKSQEHYREIFGFPIRDYYQRMGYDFEKESYEDLSDEYVELYLQRYTQAPLREGIYETLKTLLALGIPQVLLSATREDQLLSQIASFAPIGQHFDRILGVKNHYAYSKAREAEALFKSMALAPEDCLFIGDSDHDHEISARLGCKCILLTGGHQSRGVLERTGAPVLDSLQELLSLIQA